MSDPRDLGALEKAINDSAGKVSGLWLSFITFGTYLLIATGSITHRDLFLNAPMKLPVLAVDLPVTGYFLVAPMVLVVFHAYLLLQLEGLSRRTQDYNQLLKTVHPNAADRRMLRLRLDNFTVLQFLARGEERRGRLVVGIQGVISWLTIVALPVVILLQLQITFLPFHSVVTWLHRACILADLLIVWVFWGWLRPRRQHPLPVRILKGAVSVVSTSVVAAFVVCLATYPGERAYDQAVARSLDAVIYRLTKEPQRTASQILFEGSVDGVTGRPSSWFANRVILPVETFRDPATAGTTHPSVSLRGRDLRGAILSRADLGAADFTGANLIEASFVGAALQNARFGCAGVVEVKASKRARRRGRGEDCDDDRAADLRGADFSDANLVGAWFENAKLQGARFSRARLTGAALAGADLTGASLQSARLEAASLDNANLLGGSLSDAQLLGASLTGASLVAAALAYTQLQGVDLEGVDFTYAALSRVNAYRAALNVEDLSQATVTSVWSRSTFPRSRFVPRGAIEEPTPPPSLDAAGYKELRRRVLDGIADHKVSAIVGGRLGILDPGATPDHDLHVETQLVRDSTRRFKARIGTLRAIALAEAMCDERNAPFVARGFIYGGRILGAQQRGLDLAATLRSAGCAGAQGLDSSDFDELRRVEVSLRREQRRIEREGLAAE